MDIPPTWADARTCSWPHEVLSAEQERVLTEAIARHRPFIRDLAKRLCRGDRYLYRELDQYGCLHLWELGAEVIEATPSEAIEEQLMCQLGEAQHITLMGMML